MKNLLALLALLPTLALASVDPEVGYYGSPMVTVRVNTHLVSMGDHFKYKKRDVVLTKAEALKVCEEKLNAQIPALEKLGAVLLPNQKKTCSFSHSEVKCPDEEPFCANPKPVSEKGEATGAMGFVR